MQKKPCVNGITLIIKTQHKTFYRINSKIEAQSCIQYFDKVQKYLRGLASSKRKQKNLLFFFTVTQVTLVVIF